MKIKSEHFKTKFLKSDENKKQIMYTNEKFKWFKIIRALISISVKFTVLIEIIINLKLTKKHKFKKLKKFISEFNFVNVQLLDVKDIIFVNNTLQTFNIMNQQIKIIISDYYSKTSRLNNDDWKKTLKKCKHTLRDNDKEFLSIKR